jgi:hypothetical protein
VIRIGLIFVEFSSDIFASFGVVKKTKNCNDRFVFAAYSIFEDAIVAVHSNFVAGKEIQQALIFIRRIFAARTQAEKYNCTSKSLVVNLMALSD